MRHGRSAAGDPLLADAARFREGRAALHPPAILEDAAGSRHLRTNRAAVAVLGGGDPGLRPRRRLPPGRYPASPRPADLLPQLCLGEARETAHGPGPPAAHDRLALRRL